MALDPSLILVRGLSGGSADQVRNAVVRRLTAMAENDASEVHRHAPRLLAVPFPGAADSTVLYVPPGAHRVAAEITQRLRENVGNPYETLEAAGMLVIDTVRPHSEGALLSGGSFCDVVLDTGGSRATIRKRIDKQGLAQGVDGLPRHRHEADWLISVERYCRLFPQAAHVTDDDSTYAFETAFFPGYSLAESVFQRRMSGGRLAGILIEIYGELRHTLYSRPPLLVDCTDPDSDYVAKIRRRCELIERADEASPSSVAGVLRAPRITVNGKKCAPLKQLLDEVRTNPYWRPILRPHGSHACHGDLILEDILVSGSGSGRITLIDPNPYNQHGLWDLAKTMLSLWIGYEFVYFDLFDIEMTTENGGDGVRIDVTFETGSGYDEYTEAAARFVDYARTHLANFLGLPADAFDRLVRMASALTALAIPSFHLIRHGKPNRALAFLALGILHASLAMDGESP